MLTVANTTALMDFLCGEDFFTLLMTGNTKPQAVANWLKLQLKKSGWFALNLTDKQFVKASSKLLLLFLFLWPLSQMDM